MGRIAYAPVAVITGPARTRIAVCARMGLIRQTFHVRAPLELAWQYGLRTDRITEWQPGIVRVLAPDIIDHAGLTYDLVYRLGLCGAPATSPSSSSSRRN